MATWQRLGIAVTWTVALAIAGILYNEVFLQSLYPLIDQSGTFSTPIVWLNRIAPIVILVLLVAVWVWVVAGAVQDERSVDARRVR